MSRQALDKNIGKTEPHALAVSWGCQQFHMYFYGTSLFTFFFFELFSSLNNPKPKPPACVKHWSKDEPASLQKCQIIHQYASSTKDRDRSCDCWHLLSFKALCKVALLIKNNQCGSWPEKQDFADEMKVVALMSFIKTKDELTGTVTVHSVPWGTRIPVPPFYAIPTKSISI